MLKNAMEMANPDGFDEIVRRSQFDGALFIVLMFRTAQDNHLNWNSERLRSHPIQNVESVQERHLKIQKYRVWQVARFGSIP